MAASTDCGLSKSQRGEARRAGAWGGAGRGGAASAPAGPAWPWPFVKGLRRGRVSPAHSLPPLLPPACPSSCLPGPGHPPSPAPGAGAPCRDPGWTGAPRVASSAPARLRHFLLARPGVRTLAVLATRSSGAPSSAAPGRASWSACSVAVSVAVTSRPVCAHSRGVASSLRSGPCPAGGAGIWDRVGAQQALLAAVGHRHSCASGVTPV